MNWLDRLDELVRYDASTTWATRESIKPLILGHFSLVSVQSIIGATLNLCANMFMSFRFIVLSGIAQAIARPSPRRARSSVPSSP
jgi:hypothetical protein